MEIRIFKTYEIDDDTWNQVVQGYNRSFDGHLTTVEKLKNAACCNSIGYSYHALALVENQIIGFNTIIPNFYLYKKEKITLGLSGTTFVLKEYRKNIFIFYNLYNALKTFCNNDGITAFLGVPNENSYIYSIKFLKCIEVFNLPYYILPVNVSKVLKNKKLKLLNVFSHTYCIFVLIISLILSCFLRFKEKTAGYKLLTDNDFLQKRFSDGKYKTIVKGSVKFIYTISMEDNIRTAYIMYFDENGVKSFRSLVIANYYVFFKEKIDLIMYIGTMNVNQFVMLKVPSKFEPRKLVFTYNPLENYSLKNHDMNNKRDWDFSLMNLDVR